MKNAFILRPWTDMLSNFIPVIFIHLQALRNGNINLNTQILYFSSASKAVTSILSVLLINLTDGMPCNDQKNRKDMKEQQRSAA